MKKKWFKNKPLIDSITRTSRFKILELFLIILALYAAFNFDKNQRNLFSGIIYCHTDTLFTILFLAFFFLTTLNTCISFYQYDTYIIRLKDKKNLIKKLISLTLQINGLLLLIYFIIYLSLNNLVMLDSYDIKPVFDYGINTDIYSLFIVIKFYLSAILYMILNTILFVIIKENKTVVINILYLSGFFLIGQNPIYKFSFLPWYYYHLIPYQSFRQEIIFFMLYIILGIAFISILGIIGTRQKRGVAYDN